MYSNSTDTAVINQYQPIVAEYINLEILTLSAGKKQSKNLSDD